MRSLLILWTVILITLNSLGSTSRPQAEQSLDLAERKAADGRVHQQQTSTRQKQERVLTVRPIDRSALHTVRETCWPIRFVCRQTRCNCKELQTAKRTVWVNRTSSVGTQMVVGSKERRVRQRRI